MDFAHYLKHWKAAVLIYLAISILTDILCYFLNFDGVFYKGRFFSVTVAGPVGALSFFYVSAVFETRGKPVALKANMGLQAV
ncbi:TPA: hypothetical protein ACE78M_001481 [Neisseria gonorrhoeae]